MTAIAEQLQSERRPGVAASNARRMAGLVACLAVLGVTVLFSIAVGSRDIPLPVVIDALIAYCSGLGFAATSHGDLTG